MLHRAARNAYSWWWASHIRTKQSKWLEQNLQDMEEKVEYVLQIINEEGDSFAVRAEMYYKKRPELVNFVEDCFRGYRALADRYDLLSKDLQNANRTIAAVYPERVQLSMDDDYEEIFPQVPNPFQEPTKPPKALPAPPPVYISLKSASFRKKSFKAPTRLMSKKGLLKFGVTDAAAAISKSGLTKGEAIEEIDRLQKGILVLQTEKEFLKSSYENGLAKCLEIEKQITDMQVKVSYLQDEFAIERNIEDDEARMLMVATALNSCQEKLCSLQDKQEQSVDDAKVEAKRVNDVREKFETMIEQLTNTEKNPLEEKMDRTDEKMHDLGLVKVNMKEHLQVNEDASLTVSELAEKIDELVDTVINLETSVSSQNALVKRLRSESDELHAKLKSLEMDKETLIEGSESKCKKIRELEEELFQFQSCNQCVKDQAENLQSLFKEGSCKVDMPVDEVQNMVSTGKENFVQPNSSSPFVDLTLGVEVKPDGNVQNIDSSEEVSGISGVDNVSGCWIETKEEEKKYCSVDQSLYVKDEGRDYLTQPNLSNPVVGLSQDVKGSSLEKAFKEHEVDKDAGNESVSIKDSRAEEGLKKDAIFRSEQCNTPLEDLLPKGLDKDVPVSNPEKGLEENVSVPGQDPVISNHNNIDDKGKIVPFHDHDGLKKTDDEEHTVESNLNNQLDDISSNVQLRALGTNIKKGLKADENKTAPESSPVKEEENKSSLNNQLNDLQMRAPDTNTEKGLKENTSLTASSNNSLISTKMKAEEKEKENNHLDDQDLKKQENDDEKQFLFEADEEDQPNWRELFLSDLEDREKLLLKEYTSVLKNFKQLKKKLSEAEKKHRANLFKSTVQLKVLQSANASKDAEIESLHKKLNLFQLDEEEAPDTQDSLKGANFKDSDTSSTSMDQKTVSNLLEEQRVESTASEHKKVSTEESKGEMKSEATVHKKVPTEDDGVEMKLDSVDEGPIISSVEEKIRMDLDDLLEENVEFWLRYSTSFHQVQKFQTMFQDSQKELAELRENRKKDGSIEQSSVRPIYKQLREIQTELTLWLEQNGVLEDDLQNRLSSMSSIQDEISRLSSAGSQDVDETELSDYQAARFTGEVMNMKHENNKVADELLVGIQCVKRLKIEIEIAVAKLDEEFGISAARNQQTRNSKYRLPLRSFLFGAKLKKQKASLFSCISPAIQRQHSDLYSVPSPK